MASNSIEATKRHIPIKEIGPIKNNDNNQNGKARYDIFLITDHQGQPVPLEVSKLRPFEVLGITHGELPPTTGSSVLTSKDKLERPTSPNCTTKENLETACVVCPSQACPSIHDYLCPEDERN